MSDLNQVIRTLPRIKKHLFDPDNMRSVSLCEQVDVTVAWTVESTYDRLFQVCPQRHARENAGCGSAAGEFLGIGFWKQETA